MTQVRYGMPGRIAGEDMDVGGDGIGPGALLEAGSATV